MIDKYKFKRINSDCYLDLKFLMSSCFDEDVPLSRFEKKYNTECFGISNIGFLALDENNAPAAFYGVFPGVAKWNGQPIMVAQSGDTMTHPDHTRQGLFILLAKMTYKLAEESGIKLIFGFPNQNSFSGFTNKLNWTFKEEMLTFTLNQELNILKKVHSRLGILNRVQSTKLNSLTFNKVLSWQVDSANFHINRSDEYLNYKMKFGARFIKFKELVLLVKIEGESLHIGSFSSSEISSINLKETLHELMVYLNVRSIYLYLSPKHHLCNLLNNFMEVKKSLPIGYLNLSDSQVSSPFIIEGVDFDTF